MAYERLHWVESETPLSADNMNNIEDGIEELQSQKVDKVSGKALSDNNYTTAEKTKLAGIAAGAEVNVQSDWEQSDSSADDYIKNKPGNASSSEAGLMSATDKSKLDGVQAGAQVNPGAATTSASGLMSAADKTKLNGISTAANKVVTTSFSGGDSQSIAAGQYKTIDFALPVANTAEVVGVSAIDISHGTGLLCVGGYFLSVVSTAVHLYIKIANPTNSAVLFRGMSVRVSYIA